MAVSQSASLPELTIERTLASPDHREMPLVAALKAYRERGIVPFSTPGHRSGAGAHHELREFLGDDLFAADVWLNTGHFEQTLLAAEALAADAWLADRAYFLTHGSTSANHAALLGLIRPGEQAIVSRDVHKSIIAGLILVGACPVYVTPRLHPTLGISLGPDSAAISAALAVHPNAKLVILSSLNYWGVAPDIAAIVNIAHERDVPVFVDEAWGPHLPFHPALPSPAMSLGADCAVTSVHKLLGSLSQASILLTQANLIDTGRLETSVRMLRTTSPSLPILASIDACRQQMVTEGREMLESLLSLATNVSQRLEALPGIHVVNAARLGLPEEFLDSTRLVIGVNGLGLTGVEVERVLRSRFGISVEMSDRHNIICLLTIGDSPSSGERLVHALAELSRECASNGELPTLSIEAAFDDGPQAMAPRDAYFGETRAVPLTSADGEICAELVHPYPPGIPVLVPGEVITSAKVAFLLRGLSLGIKITGPADPELRTIKVVSSIN